MIRFTVVWERELQADFMRTWIDADSPLRASLTHASNWIDRNLCTDPERQGRASAVDPTCRAIHVPETGDFSIVVLYRVRREDRQVDVVAFRHGLKQ